MSRLTIFSLFFLVFLLSAFLVNGQDISIDLGPDEVAVNQVFTITVKLEGETLKSIGKFPEIPGLIMRGRSSGSATNFFNNTVTRSQSVTQSYVPEKEGKVVIKPFSISVNGQDINSSGKTIIVGPEEQRSQQRRYDPFGSDPFEDFFGRGKEPTEFVDLKDDAFLAVTIDKDEVYVGEGINVTVAFYVSEKNRAPLQFHDISNQLAEILKTIKPDNVWEENFNIQNITSEPVNIKGTRYTVFKIYQASYFPLNAQDIIFPSVGLELIKYQVAKKSSFFGQSRKEGFKKFYSKEKKVRVKQLPPHPLKDQVSVGNYTLEEQVNKGEVSTGESFQYQFQVMGEGNIAYINEPIVKQTDDLEIYAPSSRERITRSGTSVRGVKTFNYYSSPKEPGIYPLSDYFQFIFFNTAKKRYDTLRSNYKVNVIGESLKNLDIGSSMSQGLFYERFDNVSNQLTKESSSIWLKWLINIFIIIAIGFTLFILLKKS